MNNTMDGTQSLNPVVDFVAGTLSGMAAIIVGFPFDTVKVRFQNPEVAYKYGSTVHAISTIILEERFIGLYKGILSPLVTVALMNGLVFSSYRFFLKIQLDSLDSVPTLLQTSLAGALSGIVSSVITTPTELIKIRQQSIFDTISVREVLLNIFKSSGICGLYRGLVVTAIRDCGYGAYFYAYEATCRYLAILAESAPADGWASALILWIAPSIAGGVAGVAGWLATFPFDVIKTRIQGSEPIPDSPLLSRSPSSQSSTSYPSTPIKRTMTASYDNNPYRSILSTIIHSYRTEGITVFYKGLVPTLIRAVPVNMVTFATFEAVVHALS